MSTRPCSYCGALVESSAAVCSACGTPIAPVPPPIAPASESPPLRRSQNIRGGWIVFILLILLPGLITLLTAYTTRGSDWFTVAVLGNIPGAIFGGVWLSGLLTRLVWARVLIGIAFSTVLYALVFFGTCFAGCLAEASR